MPLQVKNVEPMVQTWCKICSKKTDSNMSKDQAASRLRTRLSRCGRYQGLMRKALSPVPKDRAWTDALLK